jgi:hypothetical protein
LETRGRETAVRLSLDLTMPPRIIGWPSLHLISVFISRFPNIGPSILLI